MESLFNLNKILILQPYIQNRKPLPESSLSTAPFDSRDPVGTGYDSKQRIKVTITESEKFNREEISDKEKYLLSYKINFLKNISQ